MRAAAARVGLAAAALAAGSAGVVLATDSEPSGRAAPAWSSLTPAPLEAKPPTT
jgi:hypothetical protein